MDVRLVVVDVAWVVPAAPPIPIPIPQKRVNVLPSLPLEHLHESELALDLLVGSDGAFLGARDQILQQSALDHMGNYVTVEAPDIELGALVHAHLDP